MGVETDRQSQCISGSGFSTYESAGGHAAKTLNGENTMPVSNSHELRFIIPLSFLLVFRSAGVAAQGANRDAAATAYHEANELYDQGRFAEASAAYDRAIIQDSQNAAAYHNKALADEMVDRQKAIQSWRKFVEVAQSKSDFKWDVARAQARLQILEALPKFPETLQPSRYVPEAGDYYWQIAASSEGEEWRDFPIKVFLGNAPRPKWQEGTREAFDTWLALFPLELVALPQKADIRMGWEESTQEGGHAGEEMDWVQMKRVGDQLTGKRVAIITVDLFSRNWSKEEMRAIVTHEMGHALGIKGHSESKKDIMYWQMQEKYQQIPVPVVPYPLFWKSLVKQPSQRDINTLIRLYNSAGLGKRFQ